MPSLFSRLLLVAALILSVSAQFNMFEQFFSGGQQEHHEPQNVPSDSGWYQHNYAEARCTNYLCPGTLSCVHFPHHCPCAFPDVEDKIELGEGIAVCASKGGWVAGEMERKIELARKGLL